MVVMWECDWRTLKKSLVLDKSYLYPTEDKYRMTEKQILDYVKDGSLFGVVECDIEVPAHLKPHFSEMPPIFKNITVTKSDIGDYMKEFLEEAKQDFKDTRYLIGSMFGQKILLTTPLLKWYLEHGLVVTNIYQIVQFAPKKCFKAFADQISADRRAGELLRR